MAHAYRNVIPHLGITDTLNECLCVIVVHARPSLRMPEADPPDVEGASDTARPTIRSSKRRWSQGWALLTSM